ncbi:membrane protein insertase YidC [Paenibacillus sp. JMULE4]|uniref:membrane protein insertase YidC n=1 Tax=Paenibacillus sp. JMULE4 TaxID=2518342 RepID=UPI001576B856|nr:membrane protein insertase YidC [Paenibacillus sp. JMULE4]NTZ16039.1 membrane protein insertase YidC [Paenibacillus sp. JMULE4]
MTRRLLKYIPLLFVFLLLAGCSPANAPIDRENSFWDKWFVGPLSDGLDWFAHMLWGSYGLSILVVTIIIRFIILPLTLKQYRSSKRMQELQPELKKIKDKYKDDAKKQQEETMKLFQKEGVNPLAGCFPILIQMPILIALYAAIMRNGHIGDHTFLWMQLGTKDPYYILPLLAAVTTYLQQKMMSSQTPPQMQSLMIIFPVLIFVMAMNFASALPLYWVYSNIFTIVQTYFIYKPGKAQPAVATAEAKPKSKKKK